LPRFPDNVPGNILTQIFRAQPHSSLVGPLTFVILWILLRREKSTLVDREASANVTGNSGGPISLAENPT